MRYGDPHIQVGEDKGTVGKNGSERPAARMSPSNFGVRAIAQNRIAVAGSYGQVLGVADAHSVEAVVWGGTRQAHQRIQEAQGQSDRTLFTAT